MTMFHSPQFKEHMDELEEMVLNTPTFYRVHCEMECDYGAKVWLEEEADLRARIHRHDCLLDEYVVSSNIPQTLGGD